MTALRQGEKDVDHTEARTENKHLVSWRDPFKGPDGPGILDVASRPPQKRIRAPSGAVPNRDGHAMSLEDCTRAKRCGDRTAVEAQGHDLVGYAVEPRAGRRSCDGLVEREAQVGAVGGSSDESRRRNGLSVGQPAQEMVGVVGKSAHLSRGDVQKVLFMRSPVRDTAADQAGLGQDDLDGPFRLPEQLGREERPARATPHDQEAGVWPSGVQWAHPQPIHSPSTRTWRPTLVRFI